MRTKATNAGLDGLLHGEKEKRDKRVLIFCFWISAILSWYLSCFAINGIQVSTLFLALFTAWNLRMLDDDLSSACKAASPEMDWQRIPFVIEAFCSQLVFNGKRCVIQCGKNNGKTVLPGDGQSYSSIHGCFAKQSEECLQSIDASSTDVFPVPARNWWVSPGCFDTQAQYKYKYISFAMGLLAS